ncbi:uncharacterized 30.3 kDa protein-like [Spodoptera frugiperda]|uniref:Uncharacterized 30.3 kDa protein-like n=1 Tax=Spodoptera frugiperda TaxID=7108 RepID=A0A9R0CWD4_SPOFR|nr:uncharacterized 30.3 kDa protein-like [Spodoptera frugiperda]
MNINVLLLTLLIVVKGQTFGQNATISDETLNAYNFGVYRGIIDPNKYSLELFAQHDRDVFRKTYQDYITLYNEQDEPISYHEWLVMNNYGIMPDTQESLFKDKNIARCIGCDDCDSCEDCESCESEENTDYKKLFLQVVKTGDILISGKSRGGLIGHAALMVSDYWVLEMRGGSRWKKGIKNNNRQLSKKDWYDKNKSEWTTVYRCPDKKAAERAALWADRNYFNPRGGQEKTIRITYKITADFECTNPSYSSKLVLQSYYFSTPGIIRDPSEYGEIIVPNAIPAYFLDPYKLRKIGKY